MSDEKREITGIRSAPTHTENPFLKGSLVEVQGRKKRYSVAARGDVLVAPNGQVKGTVEHTIVRVVDDSQFVKVFADGISGIYDLNSAGSKVFRYLFDEVQKHPNIDRIYLYFMDARCKLIEIAAFLDRVDRAAGSDDFRITEFRKAMRELDGKGNRAEKVLLALSDPTNDPIPAATTKAACGAWPGK